MNTISLMRCKLYDRHREKLFSGISEMFDIDNLSLDQLFITLLSSQEYDIVQLLYSLRLQNMKFVIMLVNVYF